MGENDVGNGRRTGTDKKCSGTLSYEVMRRRSKTFVLIDEERRCEQWMCEEFIWQIWIKEYRTREYI